jgi:tetratricopeptide (TPR) repeat protein
MLPIIYNQKLKQAENLKNNYKLKEALNILNDFDEEKVLTTRERFQFYFLKSYILDELFSSKEALVYAELAYQESKNLELNYEIINALMLKSRIFGGMVEPNESLKVINEAEEILAKNNQKSSQEFKLMKGYISLRKGCCYFGLGVLNLCLEFVGEASQLAKDINDKKLILQTAKWLGFTYGIKGESDRALEYQKRYLALAIELNDKQEIIGAHNTLGMKFSERGEFKRAIEHLEKGLSICHEISSWKTFVVSSSLFEVYIEENSLEKAQRCHDRMGILVKQGTFKFNEQIYRFQEAILLKKKLNENSHLKAEKIFKEFADKEASFVEFKFGALVNLCDLYLIKLKETSDLQELDKVQPYIDKIQFIAENEGVFSLLAEMYLFRAKLMLVSFKFKKAQELLTQALDIAHMHSLNLVARRIENEQTELSKNFLKWEKLRASGGKIAERMDLARVDEQIQILLQKREYLKGISSS